MNEKMMSGREESANKIEEKLKKTYAEFPILEEFRMDMRVSGLEPKTRSLYLSIAAHLLRFCGKDVKEISSYDVSAFLDSLKKEGEVQTYLRTSWYALKRFFDFASRKNGMENPILSTPRPKAKPSREVKRTYLTPDECKEFLSNIEEEENPVIRARDRAIVEVFLETGIRASALREINVEDLDFERKEVRITDKGNKTSFYPLSEEVLSHIVQYARLASDAWNLDFKSGPLFYSNRGNRISYKAIRFLAGKYFDDRKITPHKFRASFATNLYNATGDIQLVQECMNHANVSTTQIYVQSDGRSRKKASAMIQGMLYEEKG